MSYVTLGAKSEIANAERELRRALLPHLKRKVKRKVGWPHANDPEAILHFENDHEVGCLWWEKKAHHEDGSRINYFGVDDFSANSLNIMFQFNYPLDGIDRNKGGVFLRDVDSGHFVLAHRGLMTREQSRVRKGALLREFRKDLIEVDDGGRKEIVIVIAAVDSPSLVADLKRFCIAARRAVKRAIARPDAPNRPRMKKGGDGAASGGFGLPKPPLKEYFDEFFGPRKPGRPRAKSAPAEVHHGAIVRALSKELLKMGAIEKSAPVDLALRVGETLFVFEVKTSTIAQSIYTAIGQLLYHGERHQSSAVRIRRVMVLPDFPDAETSTCLNRALPMLFVAYERTPNGEYVFRGLDAIGAKRHSAIMKH